MNQKLSTNLGDVLHGDPDQIALIDLSEHTQHYTYQSLTARINAIAESMAVAPDECIGLLGANSAAFIATLFAIMRLGGIAVPMNTKFPEETLAYIAGDATLTSAYIDPALVDKLPNTLTQHSLNLPNPSALSADIVTPSQGQPGLSGVGGRAGVERLSPPDRPGSGGAR